MRRVRRPAVAGMFYSADPGELERSVREALSQAGPVTPVRALVVPHAGYVYSGGVAGRTWGEARIPDVVIVVAVNHYGLGAPLATSSETWQTPLGEIEPDAALMARLTELAPAVVDDPAAHAREHSLEVQLPFLQLLKASVRFLPLQVGSGDRAALEGLGQALARLVEELEQPALLVASTDLTHYEPDEVVRREDRHAIERILAVDGEGLLRVVAERRISMCGVAPTAAVLFAARALGAEQAREVAYATSADAGGDRDSVVGYVGCHVL